MALQTLRPEATVDDILSALELDGAAIMADVIDASTVQQMTQEVMPFINRSAMGNDDFTGRRTQRTGALVARTPTCRDLILNPTILNAAKSFLRPFSKKILLHLTQTIYIHPGNPAQPLHRDRLAWGTHIPASIEPQFNTIWALTNFTKENGATRYVAGSHKWDWKQRAADDQIEQAEMTAGSVFIYSGSVLHSGGENRSEQARLGLNLTYTLGWLRQEENQYLSCPPEIAKTLDPELQELLGYTQGDYALGYFSDPVNYAEKSDILPPEFSLGRKPRKSDTTFGDESIEFSGEQI
ncbi:MAG: phytanoyl-CoA dioxygenase family protein [Gammaproteobacteria bacterium]|nr:phytanoyl-CoA dioxygenase family protein [Gammaproteobacteria bacterium]